MPETTASRRLAALRQELAKRGLDGFVVPLTDEHQSEYVADCAQRLRWLTGFTGSAGTAVVLKEKAALFVDGRYTLQAKAQVNGALYEIHQIPEAPLVDWLADNMKAGEKVGFDPFLHTTGWRNRLAQALADRDAALVPATPNPVDAVWQDRPAEPAGPAAPYDIKYAGKSHSGKRAEIADTIRKKGADAAVITQLDSIAWLLNIRGGDVPHTPVALAFAVVEDDGAATLYIDPAKVTGALKSHLGNEVAFAPKGAFLDGLKKLGQGKKKVLADPATASVAIFDALTGAGAKIIKGMDPCALPKARKNEAELAGTRAAHVRDGAAVSNFLYWLAKEAPSGRLDEIAARDRLYQFRKATGALVDLSFDTIAGAGANGAIIHYRVSEQTNRKIKPGELFLIDSGGQYMDGTTDITRTVAIGEPGAEERERFTRVLKGHIAIATARFPKGTTGPMLDPFARKALWEAGIDYDHGTGHGVGVYLAVHEGPGRIAKVPNEVALEPGMIYSNEPGYYKEGAYGIRIENLVVVRKESSVKGAEREMLSFETITFAPIDRSLVEPTLLSDTEFEWLSAYHRQVWEKLERVVDPETRPWLKAATAVITR